MDREDIIDILEDEQFEPFYLDTYLENLSCAVPAAGKGVAVSYDKKMRFSNLCELVRGNMHKLWQKEFGDDAENSENVLGRIKGAIIGYPQDVAYFKTVIAEYLKLNSLNDEWYPDFYLDLVDAIFHENWGLAGVAPWKNMPGSSSAKIIGENIFFLINGKLKLQEQTISYKRFEQLRKALLTKTPEKRVNEVYSEVYSGEGERVAIFFGHRVKEGQPAMVFRKYIVKNFTFEAQADLGTIPKDAIPFLQAQVKLGYNVAFVGPVRTGKTTFLTTWMNYEDPTLEGFFIESDPEVPVHMILQGAPIIQVLAEGEECIEIKKEVVRSDADYIVVAEGRDGYQLDLAVEAADRGTMRCKTIYHLSKVHHFCYDVANKIQAVYGGNLDYRIVKVACAYQYLYEFIQLKDKSKKRLKSIYEMRYNEHERVISFHQICKYNHDTDRWTFKYDIGEDKKEIAYESDREAYKVMDSELKKLAEKYPMEGNNVIYPFYSKVGA